MREFLLMALAMIAFAGNSLLCRVALKYTGIDAASFTFIRIFSGALVLWLIVWLRRSARSGSGNWPSALALFAYAASFSFAYTRLPAATGALLLFGAVPATMIGYGICTGERLQLRQTAGLTIAIGGMVVLFLPGLATPSLYGSALMITSGIAWGVYSLLGKGPGDAIRVTAGNFLRAAVFAAALSLALLPWTSLDHSGIGYAVASGALASGVGYAIWYAAVRGVKATRAATVQLSVPVITTVGGVMFLSEALTYRVVEASMAILGGVALVMVEKRETRGDAA